MPGFGVTDYDGTTPGRGGRRARRKILPRIAATVALGVLFLAAAAAATTGAATPTTAVTPATPTTSPGASRYFNPYTPPTGVATFTAVPAFTAGTLTAWRHNYLPTAEEDVDVPAE